MPTQQQSRVVLRRNRAWYLDSANPLAASLVAYWPLDEISGNRRDLVGGNTLTDNNTVTSAPGVYYPSAAQFTFANSESLSIADNAALSMGDVDFWFAAWCYMDTRTADRPILIKGTDVASNANFEYALRFQQSNNRFRLSLGNGTTAAGLSPAISGPAASVWHFLVCAHDSVNDIVKISLNGAPFDTAAHTAGSFDSTHPFRIGGINTTFMDGRIAQVMVGKNYVPTMDNVDFLYSGGSGRP